MNFLASECSADCESGWTLYLEQSFLSNPNSKHRNKTNFVDAESAGFCRKGKNTREESEEDEEEEEEEEEEDLSMVSDASSGPPHFHEDESYFNCDNGHFYPSLKGTTLLNNGANYRQKKKEHSRQSRHRQDQELPPFLDDTASSPAFNFSKNNFALSNSNQDSMESVFDHSQSFSATHFQGRSTYQDHIGYTHPSLSGNKLQNNQLSGLIEGRVMYGDTSCHWNYYC
ncbi:protein SOB FIVE-LIKE 5 isoform X2 [Populus trichocarpa]|uniref:protein SOB FIVE-LIKE 5 isoform X2 n=1 Tax=Populus trichocarpa TaxID=3694 RepID=UPI000193613B|nr:protein SOB FIVE-LIKE 5 isoform X2 [Populus trichocarpa]|eukprot:XP_002298783.1 uncharacterized protein LOC7478665 isoform X2 [Populus trichocarpa]